MSLRKTIFAQSREIILRTNYYYPREVFSYVTFLEGFAGEKIKIDNLLRYFDLLPGPLLTPEVKRLAKTYLACAWRNFSLQVRRVEGEVYVVPELLTFVLADVAAAAGVYPHTPDEREVILEVLLFVFGFKTHPSIVGNEQVDTLLVDLKIAPVETKNLLLFYAHLTGRPANIILSQGPPRNTFTPAPLSDSGRERIDGLRQKIFSD